MSTIVTLSQRKAREAARRRAAAEAIAFELQAFARRCGGRILLFGSASRGRMTETSDVDLLLDVPADAEADAWMLAEHLSRRHDVPVDIHSARTTRPEFIRRIEAAARVLA